jgi:hypothetical protein
VGTDRRAGEGSDGHTLPGDALCLVAVDAGGLGKTRRHQRLHLLGLVSDVNLEACWAWVQEHPRLIARHAPEIAVEKPRFRLPPPPRIHGEIPRREPERLGHANFLMVTRFRGIATGAGLCLSLVTTE